MATVPLPDRTAGNVDPPPLAQDPPTDQDVVNAMYTRGTRYLVAAPVQLGLQVALQAALQVTLQAALQVVLPPLLAPIEAKIDELSIFTRKNHNMELVDGKGTPFAIVPFPDGKIPSVATNVKNLSANELREYCNRYYPNRQYGAGAQANAKSPFGRQLAAVKPLDNNLSVVLARPAESH
ncbi:hypothetical protein B0H13DRAFT_2024222 [Mycena leptocephala]|nr:hypothetical protein B0H13DRAFT_2024222 [Mycena leptocephala]